MGMAMSESQLLDLRGQKTNVSPLIIQNNVLRARNCVQNRQSYIEGRRGFNFYRNQLTLGPGQLINKIAPFKNDLIVQYGTKLAYGNGSVWTDYATTFNPIPNRKMHSVLENKSLYYTSADGIQKIQALTTDPVLAGVPQALNVIITDGGGGGGTPLVANVQYAYRSVIGIEDDNLFLILGPPSQRGIYITSNTNQTTVKCFIPGNLTTNHFVQIYRSLPSAGTTTTPSDELFLVDQKNLQASDISNGYFTFTDDTPDDLLGASLYTNPSQEGIQNSNYQPPFAGDIAVFKNSTFYADTKQPEMLDITLISASISNGNQITIGDGINQTTLTGAAVENLATMTFAIPVAGSPSFVIEQTARSIVNVLNNGSWGFTPFAYAYYASGFNDLPGKIHLQARSVAHVAFFLTADSTLTGGYFIPNLPTSGQDVISTNQAMANRLYFSKSFQPEAVPLGNYVDVGSADFGIDRIIALRDSLFIFKRTEGVYRLYGNDPTNFSLIQFDPTISILARESAINFSNSCYLFSSQGIVQCGETGIQLVSQPDIEDQLKLYYNATNINPQTFAFASESDRRYVLYCVQDSQTVAQKAFVFNSIVRTFTDWDIPFTSGVLNTFDDKFYCATSTGWIYQERKNNQVTDWRDEAYPVTINSFTGNQVVLASLVNVSVNQSLYQNGVYSQIMAINTGTNTLTMNDSKMWVVGAAEVDNGIIREIDFGPATGGNPSMLKHYREVHLLFDYADFQTFLFSFYSDVNANTEQKTVTPISTGSWGDFAWGAFTWGGGSTRTAQKRLWVPFDKMKCHWLYMNLFSSEALKNFAIIGNSFYYKDISPRSKT